MTDWGAVYALCVDRIAVAVGALTPDQLARTVPATPRWTVHQLLAHCAGGSTDGVAGRMDDAPSDAWTARHVAERAGATVTDLVTELRGTEDAVVSSLAGVRRPAVVWDKSVHLADLHEALGMPAPPPATWQPVLDAVRPRVVRALDADPDVDGYELFRAAFSRRSRRQLATLLPDATEEQLAGVGFFGPRDDDQPSSGPRSDAG